MVLSAATSIIPADQLYAYAAKEGLIDFFRAQIGLSKTAQPTKKQLGTVRTDIPISGYDYLGTDVFMSELDAPRKPLRKTLPKTFDLSKVSEETRINEKKQKVRSAVFDDLKTGLIALTSMLSRRRALFLEDAKTNSYGEPTQEELIYWTYVYFNYGETGGLRQLKKYRGKRLLATWITKGEFSNAIKLLRSYKMIKAMGIF